MRRCCIILLVVLTATVQSIAQAPSNDLCSGAQSTVTDGSCYSGTLTGASDNVTGEVGCATQGGPNNHRDVWYSFTATESIVDFSIGGGTLSPIEMVLLTGSCSSLSYVNSSCSSGSSLSGTFIGLVPGQVYYYVVSSSGNATGTFQTCWEAVTAPPSAGQDCITAAPICSNSAFGGNSAGFGSQELPNNNTVDGCLTTEHQSSWYYFQIAIGGSLEMTIDPDANIDYDFAIWGPFSSFSCPPSGSPQRCSYSSLYANTGMGNGAIDISEPASGDAWVAPMNVVTGEYYLMLIDNWTSNSTPFQLAWGGTAVLSCSIVPVELTAFSAVSDERAVHLTWTTATEQQSDYFEIQRSSDNVNFEPVGRVEAAGISYYPRHYAFTDILAATPHDLYYRLRQLDFNGIAHLSHSVQVSGRGSEISELRIFDLSGREYAVIPDQPGIYIIYSITPEGAISVRKEAR